MGVHVGVVSSHGHENGHITVWDKLPEVEAIHVCTIADEADLDAISSLSPKVASRSRSLPELLGRPLDAVGVCVRPDLGPPTMRPIVDAGVPVLFDKPASTRADDLREVAEVAASRGVTAGGMFQWRYSASVLEAKRALAEGGLGELWAVEMRMLTSQLRYRRRPARATCSGASTPAAASSRGSAATCSTASPSSPATVSSRSPP